MRWQDGLGLNCSLVDGEPACVLLLYGNTQIIYTLYEDYELVVHSSVWLSHFEKHLLI
jgi:hypothetical protein